MLLRVRLLLLLLSCSVAGAIGAAIGASSQKVVPSFSVSELLQDDDDGQRRSELLMSVLSTTGLLAVTFDDDETAAGYLSARREALNGLCQRCLDSAMEDQHHDQHDQQQQHIQRTTLHDSLTTRATLGTATVGLDSPMPLEGAAVMACPVDAMDRLRDFVSHASQAFLRAVDKDRANSSKEDSILLRTSHGASFKSIESIVRSANHLEHFHVYDKKNVTTTTSLQATTTTTTTTEATLTWHTDAGLFLAFAPGMDCDIDINDQSLWFQDVNGHHVQATFPPNSIGIMMGAGMEHWLSNVNFKATRHAVRMLPGQRRAWYGMMYLVPERAIIQQSPPKTFADMKRHMTLQSKRRELFTGVPGNEFQDGDDVSIGCGFGDHQIDSTVAEPLLLIPEAATQRRRRVQHVQSGEACNNVTNFFCWVQCLDIPDADLAQGYVNEGYSLYCLDPGTLQRSDGSVSQAVEPCAGGWVHNSDCLGSWQPTAPNVPAIPIPVNKTVQLDSDAFCFGGTSMYMDGFHWIHDTTCVIYLVPEWVLSTRTKFIIAAIGTILFGMALEVVIFGRRQILRSVKGHRYYRLALGGFLYGLQLTMGYLVMLVVMTYSGVLFLCVIIGLIVGNILFNAKGALLAPKEELTTKEKSDADDNDNDPSGEGKEKHCCSSGDGTLTSNSELSPKLYQQRDNNDNNVAEGATPCCMNTL